MPANPTLAPVYEYYATDNGYWRFQYAVNPDIQVGWQRNGIGFFAFGSRQPNAIPIHQYHLENPWRFRYSPSASVGQGWIYDGIVFYALEFPQPRLTIPVYQYSAINPERYHYSINPDVGQGWSNDGAVFHVYAATPAGGGE
ncbi:MAG: hypothetical protein MUF49_28440 [Oculatellaceae cyanobacterium Prado106]|jgi:hypothetical protein|nr:hypothetical protein [Oculatellaceae cyanobacterium Prado106]